jgi:ribosomal protein L40E
VIRCPRCGAANADAAAWCSQCYGGLGAEPPAGEPPAAAAPGRPAPAGDAPSPGASAGRAGAAIRRGAEGLEWVCVACETANPFEATRCTVCGTPFVARFADAEPAPPVDWATARTASLLLPGLGHVRAGHPASGWARLVLFAVWGLGGLLVLLGAGAASLPVAAPLLLGAFVIHVLSQVDLAALERGGRELLAGRTLLWLVVGVTVLVVLGAVVGLGVASPGGPGGP